MQGVLDEHKIKLFWDIDGTLLQTFGAAATPFAQAVSRFAGQDVQIERKKLSGFTDYEIARFLLDSKNIKPSLHEITKILTNYSQSLLDHLLNSEAKIIGGIHQSLTELSKMPNIELAIATGNFLGGAKVKLDFVQLSDFFDQKNLFCSTEKNWSRDLIINAAKKSLKANQYGVVIGDSLRDILSAKNSNLPVIAVATGAHSQIELLELNPDYLLEENWSHEDLISALSEILRRSLPGKYV
jgi:phosphoglycolate phosphatase